MGKRDMKLVLNVRICAVPKFLFADHIRTVTHPAFETKHRCRPAKVKVVPKNERLVRPTRRSATGRVAAARVDEKPAVSMTPLAHIGPNVTKPAIVSLCIVLRNYSSALASAFVIKWNCKLVPTFESYPETRRGRVRYCCCLTRVNGF